MYIYIYTYMHTLNPKYLSPIYIYIYIYIHTGFNKIYL